ncbi:DUF2911 domain-containing protein [Pararhodonellum marinum]|uniref:DUF2911 domain-containing protein n=1 Tax=Pararhodonellum marinum TaxID=2755358 RepID=UPI001890AA2E|nr:DUF2911 domain-containing protein [Pararhodonellum marinum]
MKKSSYLLFTFLMATSVILYSCGEKPTEDNSEMNEMMEETPEVEERPSPLRTISGEVSGKKINMQYGAPSTKDRKVWGDLVPYNEVWRTGANEATWVEFDTDVTLEGKPVSAGKYSLFTIPRSSGNWTVILNSDWDLEHGHYQYKEENDVIRVESTPEWVDEHQEQLTVAVESPGIVVRWEKLRLPITVN